MLQNEGYQAKLEIDDEGDPIRILKNPVRRTYFRLSERGWFIWQRLDGSHNLRDLTLDYLTELKSFAPHEIAVTVAELAQAGMIRTATLSPTVAAEALTDHVARSLAPHKRPRRVRFVAELPRNAMGKVQRAPLVDLVTARDATDEQGRSAP